jgi:hypothetical protein
MGASVRFRDWILVYLAAGSSFTPWAILAFCGGAVVVIVFVLLVGVVLIRAQ